MESMKTSPTGAETKTWITAVLLGWLSLTIGLYAATAAGRLLELAGANVIVVQLSKGGIISSISLAAVYYIQTRLLGRAWSDIVGDRLRKESSISSSERVLPSALQASDSSLRVGRDGSALRNGISLRSSWGASRSTSCSLSSTRRCRKKPC